MTADEKVKAAIEYLATRETDGGPVSISDRLDSLGLPDVEPETLDTIAHVLALVQPLALSTAMQAGCEPREAAKVALLIPVVMGMELHHRLIVMGSGDE